MGTLLAIVCIDAPVAGESELVFDRARVSAGVSTRVEVARQYEVTLVVPSAKCVGEPFSCTTETTFAQLYQVTVLKRLHSLGTDGMPRSEDELVHREMFATDLGQAAEQELEERLRQHIRRFHPEAALHPFSTRITGRPPLPYRQLYDDSLTPTWMCTVDAAGGTDVAYLLPTGDGYSVGNAPAEVHDAVCSALTMTILPEEADLYETPVGVQLLDLLRVEVAESWSAGSGDERSLTAAPESMGYEKSLLSPDDPGTGAGYRDADGRMQAYSSRDGVYRSVFIDEAALEVPTAASALWSTHWRIEHQRKEFGSSPTVRAVAGSEIRLAWLPLVDPLRDDATELPRVPSDWLDRVTERLRLRPDVTTDDLFSVVLGVLTTSGKARDALMIACDDTGARFAMTAFNAKGQVTNGRALCDAIEQLAGD